MAVIIVMSLCRVRLPRSNSQARWIGVGLLALSGVYTFFARTGNFDIPYLLWWILSFVCLWRYLFHTDRSRRWLIGVGVFSAMAVATKDQAAGLALGSLLVILAVGPNRGARSMLRVKDASLFGVVTLIAYLLLAVAPQPIRWARHFAIWAQYLPGVERRQPEDFANTLFGHIGLLKETLLSLSHVVSWAGIVLAVVGAIHLMRHRHCRELMTLLLPAFAYYATIICSARFVCDRYLLPVACLVVLLATVGVTAILSFFRTRGKRLHVVGYAGVFLVLFYQLMTGYLPVTYFQVCDTKRHLASALPTSVPKGSYILWIGAPTSLPNSKVYQDYSLVLPPDVQPWSRSVKHVFHSYDMTVDFILSEDPLDLRVHDVRFIRAWTCPKWVWVSISSQDVRSRVKEFYLYQRTRPD